MNHTSFRDLKLTGTENDERFKNTRTSILNRFSYI